MRNIHRHPYLFEIAVAVIYEHTERRYFEIGYELRWSGKASHERPIHCMTEVSKRYPQIFENAYRRCLTSLTAHLPTFFA